MTELKFHSCRLVRQNKATATFLIEIVDEETLKFMERNYYDKGMKFNGRIFTMEVTVDRKLIEKNTMYEIAVAKAVVERIRGVT